MGYDKADFFVGDLVWYGLFDGFQQVEAEPGAGFEDVLVVNGVDPVWAERGFAFFDEVGDESYNRGDFSAAELGDFLEGAALIEQFQGFLRGA